MARYSSKKNRTIFGNTLVFLVAVFIILASSTIMIIDDTINHRGSVDIETPFDAPQNLIVADSILWWDTVHEAQQYIVYIHGIDGGRMTDNGFLILHDLIEGQEYSLDIVAVKDDGQASEHSSTLDFVYHSITLPSATKLSIPELSTDIAETELEWKMISNTACFSVICNNIEIAQTQKLNYKIAGTLSKANKSFRLKALSGRADYAHSDLSNIVSLSDDGAAPDKPALLDTPILRVDGMQIKWDAIKGASSYDMILNGQELFILDQTTIYNLAKDTGYIDITVRARSAAAESNWSSVVRFFVPTMDNE